MWTGKTDCPNTGTGGTSTSETSTLRSSRTSVTRSWTSTHNRQQRPSSLQALHLQELGPSLHRLLLPPPRPLLSRLLPLLSLQVNLPCPPASRLHHLLSLRASPAPRASLRTVTDPGSRRVTRHTSSRPRLHPQPRTPTPALASRPTLRWPHYNLPRHRSSTRPPPSLLRRPCLATPRPLSTTLPPATTTTTLTQTLPTTGWRVRGTGTGTEDTGHGVLLLTEGHPTAGTRPGDLAGAGRAADTDVFIPCVKAYVWLILS